MRTNKRVTAVIVRDHKILLFHRFNNGREYWIFPGGGVEEGENIETALKREVKEETGFEIESYVYLFDQPDDYGNTCPFFFCQVGEEDPKLGGPEVEEQSQTNQYIFEWIDVGKVLTMDKVFPKPEKLNTILTDPRLLGVDNATRE